MRWIRENQQPEALIRCLVLRRGANQPLDYDEVGVVEVDGVPVSISQGIREARLLDQGFLCAYTLRRIDKNSSHNEHLVPRSVSKAEGRVEETLDYRNIVACYPKREAKGGCPYGAPVRGNTPLALTPLEQSCEARLRFDRSSSRFEPTNPDDVEVRNLVENVLKLNHDALIQRRRQAINEAGVGLGSKPPITAADARRLAHSVLEFRRGKALMPFCTAVAQAALAHADLIERRSKMKRQFNRKRPAS